MQAKKTQFRVNSQQFFITWPNCPLPKEHILDTFKVGSVPLIAWIVAEELHEDLKPHVHAYFKFERKLNIKSERHFDLEGLEGEVFHANFAGCRSENACKKYCRKDGNYISNLTFYVGDVWSDALELAAKGKTQEAIAHVRQYRPRDYTLSKDKIVAVMRHEAGEILKQHKHYYSFDNYSELPDWDHSLTLILVGSAGVGKTELAKLLLPRSLMISHIDRIREYDSTRYDGLIYDDCPLAHLHKEAQIHHIDVQNDRDVHCRYSTGHIPAGTRRIFTTYKHPSHVLDVSDPAILRRLQIWQLSPPVDDKIPVKVFDEDLSSTNQNQIPGYRWN